MEFRLTPEQEKFRQEVREFAKGELTPEIIEESSHQMMIGPHSRPVLRKMGARGWISMTWPKEYGGQGRPIMDRFLLGEELAYQGAPGLFANTMGIRIVAPTLLLHASEEMKHQYLPPIAAGEIEFALGYTEPDAGSDLASLKIRAMEDGDDFVITGKKRFNTGCHFADYHWLAARTDENAPKHKGISLFIVDLKSPGISLEPLHTYGGWRTNEVTYDHVRVPKSALVGEKNRGFYYIATALAFERMIIIGYQRRVCEMLVAYAKETKRNGTPLIKDPIIRNRLASVSADLEICRLLSLKIAWMQSKGMMPGIEASVVKVFARETEQRVADLGMQMLGPFAELEAGSRGVVFHGEMQLLYRHAISGRITGGTNEIQRNIIAVRGLGLPRGIT